MAARYILAAFAAIFLVAALWRLARNGFKLEPASRTWLLVALIFFAVSSWLWWSGGGATS
jgi:hypothetical protein